MNFFTFDIKTKGEVSIRLVQRFKRYLNDPSY